MAYRNQALKLGMINALGIAIGPAFNKHMQEVGAAELAENLGMRSDSQGFLGHCIRGKNFSANPVLNAIIQSTMFSSPQEFLAAATAEQKEMTVISDELGSYLEGVKESISRVCTEFPEISRNKLRALVRRNDISLVIKYDHEWLERKIPRNRVRFLPRNESGSEFYARRFDERAVKHLECAYAELVSSPDLPRITQRRLLVGLPSASVFKRMKLKLPRAESLLEKLTETKEQHSLRRVKTWLPDVHSPEDLSHERRKHLVRKHREEKS